MVMLKYTVYIKIVFFSLFHFAKIMKKGIHDKDRLTHEMCVPLKFISHLHELSNIIVFKKCQTTSLLIEHNAYVSFEILH